jgi:hypothetical protein
MESLAPRSQGWFPIFHRAFPLTATAVAVVLSLCLPLLSPTTGVAAIAAEEPQQDVPQVEVLDSSAQGITLDVTVPPVLEEEVQRRATTYQRLTLQSTGTTSEIGQPELPSFGRFVAIPRGAEVQVEVLADTEETRTGYLLYPAQEPRPEQGEEPPFVLEAAAYQVDEYRPTKIVSLEGPYVIRGVEVVLIRFHPVQYNAADRALRLHPNFRLRVSFIGGESFADQRVRSAYFDSLLSRLVLNPTVLHNPSPALSSGLGSATGCDFLIITHPNFLSQANLLADWKTRRGIDTRVRTTAQTGSTASAIKSYIQNAYDTWSPAPSFVLFLGDADYIPTNYETVHPQQQPSGSLIATDLYYATVDGSDYFPDISTGRISVDTAGQASYIINSIINYERFPPYKASFYSTVTLAAYFEDEDEPYNREDRDWVKTSEAIASYLGNLSYYDEQRIYYAEPTVNPLQYQNGASLPFYLLRESGFPWNGNTAQIVNWVNSGTLILNHRDHGMRWMWVTPELQVSHVLALTNAARLPIVFSINCETGWFDNETDDPLHGTSGAELCFAEAWQRNQNGGAAGVVAATRLSYGGYNDYLDKGLIDAIWPGFLPYTPDSGPFSNPQYRMGQVLDYAKLYMATIYGENEYRKIHFEMFHYFGDPTMEIWTRRPWSMTVYSSPLYYTGATSYTVRVQDGALVSLVEDGNILGTAVAADGKATVNFAAPLSSGTVYLTITRHNRRPYESTIDVVGMPFRAYLPLSVAP